MKRSRALNTWDAPDFNRVWRGWGPPHGKSRQTIDRNVTREEARPGCPQCGQEMVAAYDKAPEGGIPSSIGAMLWCKGCVWHCDP